MKIGGCIFGDGKPRDCPLSKKKKKRGGGAVVSQFVPKLLRVSAPPPAPPLGGRPAAGERDTGRR